MKDIAICLLAFKAPTKDMNVLETEANNFYLESAKRLIKRINKHSTAGVCLMTNIPSYFQDVEVDMLVETEDVTAYTDKIKICEYALYEYRTALYVDCDCRFFIDMIPELDWEPGFHSVGGWFTDNDTADSIKSISYFKSIRDYCELTGLNFDNAPLINERMFAITGRKEHKAFFELYKELAEITKANDIQLGNYPIGRGEGLAMGLSILNSKIKWNDKSDSIMKLYSTLRHNPQNDENK